MPNLPALAHLTLFLESGAMAVAVVADQRSRFSASYWQRQSMTGVFSDFGEAHGRDDSGLLPGFISVCRRDCEVLPVIHWVSTFGERTLCRGDARRTMDSAAVLNQPCRAGEIWVVMTPLRRTRIFSAANGNAGIIAVKR